VFRDGVESSSRQEVGSLKFHHHPLHLFHGQIVDTSELNVCDRT
jgi:hypothetical protein